jgi:hypothetical protein
MHRFTEPTPVGNVGHTLIEVFVSGWEIECCAPPPVVGESTTWRLDFIPAGSDYPAAELDRDRSWQVSRRADGSTALQDGPVTALWSGHAATPPGQGRATLRGHLYGNAHGPAPDDAPVTTGTVRRVRVASQRFSRTADRTLLPVPGTVQLRDVQRGPRRFAPHGGLDERDETRLETGVLIDMAVRDVLPAGQER